jgi:RHS repeat-associated protein
VVALSDSDADTVQTYEYSVYGQVAASDPDFLTNPYMFTGRRFDIETGLYYYRARYYNPHIGRFMQTDPVGYEAGMNLYLYCMNNPVNLVDPFGQDPCDPCDSNDKQYWEAAGYKSLSACIGDKLVLCGGVWNAIGGAALSSAFLTKVKLIVKIASIASFAVAVYCAGEVFGAWNLCTAPAENFPEPEEESTSLYSATPFPLRDGLPAP